MKENGVCVQKIKAVRIKQSNVEKDTGNWIKSIKLPSELWIFV